MSGSNAYCSDCLVKDIDEDVAKLRDTLQKSNPNYQTVKTPIPIRFATVFNKEGKPVCRVDLLKHPDLMPNFAKPAEQMVYQASKSKRKLASVAEEDVLPFCPDQHLSQLKKIAKNNIVINSDKPFVHKASLQTYLIAGGAVCVLGGTASRIIKLEQVMEAIFSSLSGVGFSGSAAIEHSSIKSYNARPFDRMSKNIQKEVQKNIIQAKKSRLISLAAAIGSFCYAGTEIITYDDNSPVMK